jgi:naphthalene 1,2-dioxygenase ferredoxin component
MTWTAATSLDQLTEGDVCAVTINEREIALYLVEGQVFASDNHCTHGDARLSEGFLMDHCIECPLHQGQFDVRTGEPMCSPVTQAIKIYPAKIEAGKVLVQLG